VNAAGTPPRVLRPHTHAHDGQLLCAYDTAVTLMDELVARPKSADDVLIVLQHPPTLTLGRKGGLEHVAAPRWQPLGQPPMDVPVHEVARGGSVTWHAPGQLVVYPILQLNQQLGPWGNGQLGDLPAFVRLLERCIAATCTQFGVATVLVPGRSGVFIDAQRKIASLGLGLRNGWTFHGLALNVNPRLDGFAVTPCGLEGVQMASIWQVCDERALPRPEVADVQAELERQLALVLQRRST
jgi:lipoyl(octanoyl) transferase